MRQKKRLEVAATIVLGVVCAFLVLRLVVRVWAVSAGPSSAAPIARLPEGRSGRVVSMLPQKASAFPDGPVLNVTLFNQLEAHPLAAPDRDPFSFMPTPAQIQQSLQQHAGSAHNRPTGPPPPPPVPLKALGYTQDAQGRLQAYLTDSQNIYAVYQGEQFDKVYRLVKITPAFVEIEDESLNLRAQLAIPQ